MKKNDLHTGLISNIDNLTKNDLETLFIYNREMTFSKFEDFLNSIIKRKKQKNIFNIVLENK